MSQETSLKEFLEKNPKLELIKAARDSRGGIWKLLDAGIFAFLLFSPVLPLIQDMDEPVWIIGLVLPISLIFWSKIEYCHRSEVWHMCLYRGVVLEFPHTNKPKLLFLATPMLFVYFFMLVYFLVAYIGLDPDFKLDESDNFIKAGLGLVATVFVLSLTKAFVDLEGAPALLTLNMAIAFFQDPELLKAKGFKTVHFSCLQKFIEKKRASKDTSFSWDEVHALSSEPEHTSHVSLVGGTKAFMFMKKFKDVDS